MRGYFADELLLITPSSNAAGVSLFGEVVGTHKGPLAVALAEQSLRAQEITVDLAGVHYLANSALEILVALANSLRPPRRLLVRAPAGLGLRERVTAHGWDRIEALRLIDA
ncbi:hypothetical protein [Streptomyces flavofungini]|uniref:hypothetical protein n=1 Tax=Streptomyces flavofungini TaxID=68200 RepID=UPI0034DE4964